MSHKLNTLASKRGSTTTEYSFIVALLNVALVITLSILSSETSQPYMQLAECLYDVNGGKIHYDDAGDPQWGGGSCSTMTPPESTK